MVCYEKRKKKSYSSITIETIMKYLIRLAIALLIPICVFAGGSKQQAYRIRSISKKGDCYVIRASRNDSLFLIISENHEEKPKGEKIRFGKSYFLDLEQVFPLRAWKGIPVVPNPGVVGMGISDRIILKSSKRYHRVIYVARNLDGKYLKADEDN